MPVPMPPKSRPLLRARVRKPWTPVARRSPALRKWCDRHGYITPNFSWAEMACTDGTPVPKHLRGNARRHCFNLERFRHALGMGIRIDGPYRTPSKNREVGGVALSRHMQADATDHFADQVDRMVDRSKRYHSRGDIVRVAERIFAGVGNETSGTLHVDSRPGPWVRFVTWRPGR